MLLLIIWRY